MSRSSKKKNDPIDMKLTKNRLGLDPPKRINVANDAVANELLASQNLLFLQQNDYYKAQEHISMLDGEVNGLKEMLVKKQDLISRLKIGIAERDDKIKALEENVHSRYIDESAYKVLAEQNEAVVSRFEEQSKLAEKLQRDLMLKSDEAKDIREYSDNKVRNATATEVKLTANIQEMEFKMNKALDAAKKAGESEREMRHAMNELEMKLKFVSETSKEQLYRSRQTEYVTLKRLDEISMKYQIEKDDKELLQDSVRKATMRGDTLEDRLSNVMEKSEGQQLMVESIVRQVESTNDLLRSREKLLEKQNMNLTAQLKVSQIGIVDMIRRYKIIERESERTKKDLYELKQKNKPKRKGAEEGKEDTSLGGMGGSSVARSNKLFMDKLGSLTQESIRETFPNDIDFQKEFRNHLKEAEFVESHPNTSALNKNELSSSNGIERFGDNAHYNALSNLHGMVAKDNAFLGDVSNSVEQELNKPLPQTTEELQVKVKERHNLLSTFLRLLVNKQNDEIDIHRKQAKALASVQKNTKKIDTMTIVKRDQVKPGQIIDLVKCGLTDSDLKYVLEWFRLLQLKNMMRIDLRHNHLSSNIFEMISAFIAAIPGTDLQREKALEIDLRFNYLSKNCIRKLGARLQGTNRAEVNLVVFEEQEQVILLYGQKNLLVRIDCREQSLASTKNKKSLKEKLSLGGTILDNKLPVLFPGDDASARNPDLLINDAIYPSDQIMRYNEDL